MSLQALIHLIIQYNVKNLIRHKTVHVILSSVDHVARLYQVNQSLQTQRFKRRLITLVSRVITVYCI